MHIVIDDVLLRRPEPKDVERLYQYRNNWEVISSLEGFSSGFATQDLHDWIEAHRDNRHEVLWVIASRQSDECLGHAGLYNIDHRLGSAEFGILIGDKTWWGQGVGSAVSGAVLQFGFQQLNLHRVQLKVLTSNSVAIHVYEKLGFTTEGRMRDGQFRDGEYLDVLLMSLLVHEWRRRPTGDRNE